MLQVKNWLLGLLFALLFPGVLLARETKPSSAPMAQTASPFHPAESAREQARAYDRGWEALLNNDPEEARLQFSQADSKDPLVRIGWFLSFAAAGPSLELQNAGLTLLRESPTASSSEFVLKWMTPYRECLPDWAEEAWQAIKNVPQVDLVLASQIANHQRLESRMQEAKPDFLQYTRAAAFPTQWRISRRFGKYPLPAYAQSWPPESLDFWPSIPLRENVSGVVLPPRDSMGPGVVYAYTEFQNPSKQPITLRVFSYHNLTLWIDGKIAVELRNMEELGQRLNNYQLELGPGLHEVMVKTTQSGGRNGQFSLQIAGKQALSFPVPGVPKSKLAGHWKNVARVSLGLEQDIRDKEDGLARLVRAFLADFDKDDQTQLELLDALGDANPGCQLIGAMRCKLYLEGVRYLPQEEQLSKAYQLLNGMLQDPARTPWNRYLYAGLMIRAKQTKPALETLVQLVKENPYFCGAVEDLLELANQDNVADVRADVVQSLEALGPDNRWAREILLKEARRAGDLDNAKLLLQDLGRLLPWDGYLADYFDMLEDHPAAIKDLLRRYEVFTERDFYPYNISKAYAKLGDFTAQREWLERTLVENPGNREALLDLVNLDLYAGNKDAAKARIRDYLALESGDSFFRQRLGHLEGRNAFEDLRVDTRSVIEQAKQLPISKNADSELLLDQLMVRLFPDGSQMRYTHLVTRVLTKEGVDSESELNLPDDLEVLELRTIKADGSVSYPEDFQHKSSLSLTGIGVGDFIDEEHIEYLPPAYYDSDGLDASMTFIFQGIDRIYHHSELVLIYPEDLDPQPVLLERNMPHPAEISSRDGLKVVRWLAKEMPPMHTEPAMPPTNYIQPTASFTYNTTWDEIRDFYLNAVNTRLGLANPLKRQIEVWRASEKDPRKLAEKIYTEICDRTEPGQQFYRDVNLVWESKIGNACLLLNALYREMGYSCDLVFAKPEVFRYYTFDAPQPDYSYALLRLKVGNETIWLDPNQKGLPFGYIPFEYRDGEGLALVSGPNYRIRIPKFDDESEKVVSDYKVYLKPNGNAEGMGEERFYGNFAPQLAKNYEALNTPEIKQRVEAGMNTTYPGAEVSAVRILPDLPRGEFALQTDFSHPSFARVSSESLALPFPLPSTGLLERYGTQPSRTMPIRIPRPHYNIAKIELTLPEGYHWLQKTKTLSKKSAFGNYKLSITRTSARSLLVEREYQVPAQFIEVNAYQDFLVFCRALVENEGISFEAEKDSGAP